MGFPKGPIRRNGVSFTAGYVRLVGQEPAPSKCVFLSTSRIVRREMRDWVVTDEGDRWTVKLDVRDLGGHLDTTFRGWSSTLAARVRLVLARLLVVFALPLPFHGRMVVLRNMFIPGALHGIDASFLAESSVRKLRAAFCKVCWSSRQPLAHVGAVLSLLDGPVGSDPAFCVVWFRFRLMRRYLAKRPDEVSMVKRLLSAASEGCSGHGPAHLLVESAAEIGFSWCSQVFGWIRPGLPVLAMVAGPIQHFRSAILDAWRHRVSMSLCSRKGFRGGSFLDVSGTLQLLNSDHVRERDKALLRGVLVGGVWNGFYWGRSGTVVFLVGFAVVMIMMVIFFGIALFHLLLRFVKILNFTNSWRWISLFGLGACSGMGGCLCYLV